MRQIIFHKETKTFHLYNEKISYILCVLENGHLGQLYFGKRLHDKADFSYLVEKCGRPMTSYIYEWDRTFSLEHIRQEYPVYGTTDYRHPAIELLQENGSRISEFQYDSYEIIAGKPKLSGLPVTYTESEEEAQTLRIFLKDALTGAKLALLYTIFDEYSAIARSAYIENAGEKNLHVLNMMSLSLDLPDKDYEWMQLSGAWSRERYIKNRTLEQGITAIDSMRGNSSHEHNPFLVLKRHNTDENAGEAIGISLVYSGNFRMQAEVDTHDVTRITAGINPEGFDWKLEPGESFQTPEAVLVYSENGLNGMSQTFQKLYAKRLARGYWRDKARPILNNNWEATYFDFTEDVRYYNFPIIFHVLVGFLTGLPTISIGVFRGIIRNILTVVTFLFVTRRNTVTLVYLHLHDFELILLGSLMVANLFTGFGTLIIAGHKVRIFCNHFGIVTDSSPVIPRLHT